MLPLQFNSFIICFVVHSVPVSYFSSYPYKTVDLYVLSSYFIKILIEKKYALPYRVLDALVAHFMKFYDDSREMPVIWHQSLLAFAQRYAVFSWHFSLCILETKSFLTTQCKSLQRCLLLFESCNWCRYKNELTKENKADLNNLVERQRHKLVRLSPLLVKTRTPHFQSLGLAVNLHFSLLCRLHQKYWGS